MGKRFRKTILKYVFKDFTTCISFNLKNTEKLVLRKDISLYLPCMQKKFYEEREKILCEITVYFLNTVCPFKINYTFVKNSFEYCSL